MKMASILVGLTMAIANGASADERTTEAPEAGTYLASISVQDALGDCVAPYQAQYTGEVSFAGLGGEKHYIRVPTTGIDTASVSVQTLTTTTRKGTINPAGTLSWTGGGIGASWNYTGTWGATITEVGSHAFAMLLSESYGDCTEYLNISLVRIGANQ